MSFDLYQEITNRMIAELSAGRIPWQKPWKSDNNLAISHVTGKPYSLLNQIMLHWRPGEYISYRQCSGEGGKVAETWYGPDGAVVRRRVDGKEVPLK